MSAQLLNPEQMPSVNLESPLGSSEGQYSSEYTVKALYELGQLKKNSVVERDGEVFIDGRAVVGRNTVIDADHPAIDIRSWRVGAESIVIDSKKYPREYNRLKHSYDKNFRRMTFGGLRNNTEETKLRGVFETVKGALNYNRNYVKAWEEIKAKQPKESLRKVGLEVYLHQGEGVCRHMALAAAWLGGELLRTGELSGNMTTGASKNDADNTGHAWARYTGADGIVYIIDPAQDAFGKLTDFLDDRESWEYFRPGERNKYDALMGKGEVDPAHIVFGAGRIVPRIHK